MLALFLADEIKAARTPGGTVTIELAERESPLMVSLHVRTRAEADALVKAAAAARDLLPEPAPPLPAYAEAPGIEHCGPGECICGAHVSATGEVIPAVAS